jgi:hypothetical protein
MKKDEMARACSTHEMRNSHKIWLESLKGKRPLRRPTCRWEDNIKMDIKDMGWESVNWINLAQDRDQWWALVHGN